VPIPRDNRQQLPWPTDYILSERDREYFGVGTSAQPCPTASPDEPKNLAVYVPEQWPCKADWHSARSSVAQSLHRPCGPEIAAMIGQGPLAHYTGEPQPLRW
jgi:hypothetical protein